ncbi:mannosyltransferase OCH1-like enzyme [Pedobacter sp. UYEF25]
MAIPKIIHQTFKTANLPFITRWHIAKFKRKNPEYKYEFYDDERIIKFLTEEYNEDTLSLYKQINIGAAKADFFRYALLLKKGGVYLDVDSGLNVALDSFILPTDEAIISAERNPGLFVQWALIFNKDHPFLKKTFDLVCDNIRTNKYPNDVHQMTGPTVYTEAINQVLKTHPNTKYRLIGIDYKGYLKFKYAFSKLLYKKGEHWKKMQLTKPVLLP